MSKWVIDSDHTVAAFKVTHFMVADVHGQFNKISGTIHFDPPDLTTFSVDVSIDTSVMTTGIEKRDAHLKSRDFLDVANFPDMTFKSNRVELTGLNRFNVNGELTIRGISKPAVLDAEYLGPIKSPWGETTIGIRAATTIDRFDYGEMWNEKLENNGVVAGRYVHITLNAEADLTGD
jgi:polyisoprenoid-binding protein YceI